MRAFSIPAVLLIVGAAIFWNGQRLPAYNNPDWEKPFIGVMPQLGRSSDDLSERWYAAKTKAQTSRNEFMDLGLGVMALGVGFAGLFVFTRTWNLRDLGRMATPRSHGQFYLLAVLTWLSFVPAETFWLTHTQRRGDYPWWGDSIAIPIASTAFFAIITLPFIVAGVWIAARKATLPVRVFGGRFLAPPYLVTLGLVALFGLACLVTISAVLSEPFMVPSCVLVGYLILSGRAAAASRSARLTSRSSGP